MTEWFLTKQTDLQIRSSRVAKGAGKGRCRGRGRGGAGGGEGDKISGVTYELSRDRENRF